MDRPARSMYMDILEQRELDGSLYRVTIAANEKVRQPPQLSFGGLSTDNYTKNPVVMWAHDAVGRSPSGGLPIGRTLELTKTADGRIVADFEFLSDDTFAQRVKNAWDKGFLQAASISWIPVETVPVQGGGWRDSRSDLLEWSIVSVPADPEALRESCRRMMDEFLADTPSGSQSLFPGVTQRLTARADFREQPFRQDDEKGTTVPELSPDECQAVTAVLARLGEALDRVRPLGGAGPGSLPIDQSTEQATEQELTEIRALVGAIKVRVANPEEEL